MFSAEFFDIFGFMGFIIISLLGIWMLTSNKKLPRWAAIILLIIGVLGLIIDGYIVFSNFII